MNATRTEVGTESAGQRLTCTIDEAAELLGVSRHLAYRAANAGDLPVIRVGRRMLVPRAALERLLTEGVER
jgi:excisionase family DNA binding protein